MKVSAIIPFYNEEKTLDQCLESLTKQTFKDLEIVMIDDGSSDRSLEIIQKYPVVLLKQSHKGPGEARNLGAKEAKGEILVFVDADMVFDPDFIEKLVEPIIEGKTIGTFSKEEYVLNKENIWSKCWNINKGLPYERMHPKNYPEKQAVFRAILRKKFLESGGFKPIGYVDDHTIADALGTQADAVKGAIFYHRNPESLGEIYHQARWIGKSEYKRRKIENESLMRVISLIRYSIPFSIFYGTLNSVKFKLPAYFIFKTVYDFGVEISLLNSFFGEQSYK